MKHLAKRALVFALVLAMTLSTVVVTALADENALLIAPNPDDGSNVHVLEASALTAFGEGAKADGDTEAVGGYFTLIYSAKSKVDSSTKTWEDGYTSGQRVNFGGKATTGKNSVKFTTSGPATVKIWWVQGGDDNREIAILNSEGQVVVKTTGTYKKGDPYLSTLELTDAGTYFLGGETNNNYLFKLQVTEAAGPKPPRAPWADSAAPSIKEAAVNAEKPEQIDVTVEGTVGYDAADKISVTMTGPEGTEPVTVNSLAEKAEHALHFTPEASGTYTFAVTATREGEEAEHKGAETKSVTFVLPLKAPVLKSATNNGGGSVTVEWNAVPEAESYVVKAGDKTVTTKECAGTVEGLTVGETVKFTVAAVRGKETGPEASIEAEVKAEKQAAWVFAAYGTSTSKSKNTFEGDANDGSVTVRATGGGGKIVPNSNDGLSFYYTSIDPKTTNFVLSAKVHVNSWLYSNGQEGFGLLATDRVGVHGSTEPVFTNSYMICATKVEYRWLDGKVVAEGGDKISMQLGVGALARTGVDVLSDTKPDTYTDEMTPLDFTCAEKGEGTYNLVGNTSDPSKLKGPTVDNAPTDFIFTITKDNTGYCLSYTDPSGKTFSKQYYETDILNKVDDLVYIGFFAARNADVTFTDIVFTTSDPATDPPAREPEKEKVDLKVTFLDSGVSNTSSYTMGFTANADGTVSVTDAAGEQVFTSDVKAGVKVRVPLELSKGGNTYKVTVTPDKDFVISKYEELSSFEPQTWEHTVSFTVDERTEIVVAPNGKAGAKGTREDPAALADVLKNPAPGTVILLTAGTYKLSATLTVSRGINGTEEAPITLKADPKAVTRPVLDFGGKGGGLVIVGDWWHLIGFDITNSATNGLHVAGNHITVERVNAYRNGNTGIQISRDGKDEELVDWPSYNTILNCSSWLNADPGYEDADGFAAKLTCGVDNVFDGCISAYNADDGWDLFARGTSIGVVTVRNCVAFKNGYDIVDGKEVSAGNGNGFKLGGENFPGGHILQNCVAFANKSNGITSNSCPDVKAFNCISFANGGAGLSFYTNISSLDTDFAVSGLISYKNGGADGVKGQNGQDESKHNGASNHYDGAGVSDDWFVSVDIDAAILSGISRNADGTISMNGFLELTDKAPADAGARLPGAQKHNYRDIIPSAWYYAYSQEMYGKNIMRGTSASEFSPSAMASRAMVAAVLHRLAASPAPKGDSTFSDVKKTDWFASSAAWVEEGRFMAGTDGKFDPDGSITRQDAVQALYLYAKSTGLDVDVTGSLALSKFTDAGELEEGNVEAMTWAVSRGIIGGTSASTLSPDGTLTRAELAAILSRFLFVA